METTHTEAQKVDIGKYWPVGVVMAILGFLGLAITSSPTGEHTFAQNFFGHYIYGLVFWIGITLGCFGLSMLHHAVRGSWSVAILRLLESGGGPLTLIVMALMFVPLIAGGGMGAIYEWTHYEEHVKGDPILEHKAAYLSEPRWIIFLVLYFVLWIFWANKMRKSTIKQDETKNFRLEAIRSSWGAAGMVMFMLTATFAVVDWVMSMTPHWYSTMYGAWMVVGSTYGALALMVMIVCYNADKEPYRSIMHPNLTKDFGNMLFVLTMLWGYTTLSQFLIIWSGNIPETTSYYTARMMSYPDGIQGNLWGVVGFILLIGMFFIPFYSLLAPRTKRYPSLLKKIATWMFVMSMINMLLIVVPSVPERARPGPLVGLIGDLCAWLAIGGVWLAVFFYMTKKAPLLPLYDTRLQEAKAHAH